MAVWIATVLVYVCVCSGMTNAQETDAVYAIFEPVQASAKVSCVIKSNLTTGVLSVVSVVPMQLQGACGGGSTSNLLCGFGQVGLVDVETGAFSGPVALGGYELGAVMDPVGEANTFFVMNGTDDGFALNSVHFRDGSPAGVSVTPTGCNFDHISGTTYGVEYDGARYMTTYYPPNSYNGVNSVCDVATGEVTKYPTSYTAVTSSVSAPDGTLYGVIESPLSVGTFSFQDGTWTPSTKLMTPLSSSNYLMLGAYPYSSGSPSMGAYGFRDRIGFSGVVVFDTTTGATIASFSYTQVQALLQNTPCRGNYTPILKTLVFGNPE